MRSAGDSAKTVIDKVFGSTIHTPSYTREILRDAAVEQAAEAIRNAAKVLIVGLGNSHAIALDVLHKLMRLGRDATAYTDPHLAAIAAAYAAPMDCARFASAVAALKCKHFGSRDSVPTYEETLAFLASQNVQIRFPDREGETR